MKRILLSLTAIALLAASCGKEGAGVSDAETAPKYIAVEAEIGLMTRATTTGNSTVFDQGDKIKVYAWTNTQTDMPQSFVVAGVDNVKDDGKWIPEIPMLWKDMTFHHYFLSVYPSRQIADFTADPFTIDEADYEQSDLLYAVILSGLKASDNPVSLRFDHAMSKLHINMQFRNQWDNTPEITSCTARAAKSCKINYLAKTFQADEQTSVVLNRQTTAANFEASYSGLIIPQAGFRTVVISIGGQDYIYTHTKDIPLVPGKFTTLNLIVGREKIEIESVDINDWTEETTLSGGRALQ